MHPKHTIKVPESVVERVREKKQWVEKDVKRRAIAPYNFVELPEKVVSAEPHPDCNRYLSHNVRENKHKRYTGKLSCKLTTASPLYIRSGLTPSDFEHSGDKSNSVDDLDKLSASERARRADFFKQPGSENPCIPGSSLRGMLRSLIEIASFSKIDKVSDAQKLFFRTVAMATEKDALAAEYKEYVAPEHIQAGYLRQDNEGWYIQPAMEIKGHTFAWVKQTAIALDDSAEFKKFDDGNYTPQYILVSFSRVNIDQDDRAKRFFAESVGSPKTYSAHGQIVTSGSMSLSGGTSPRRNHCVVFKPGKGKLRLDSTAIHHYSEALTDFQKQDPFSEESGFLKAGRAVFYHPPQKNKAIGFFGQSPNFRIPYSQKGNGHAATAKDFVPKSLRDPGVTDLTESIFGYVRGEKQEDVPQSCAGRIFVGDADYSESRDGTWLTQGAISPPILGEPKPTTVAHYLVQPEETESRQSKLKHYAHPLEKTVIRGHKLYWHKGDVQLSKLIVDAPTVEESKTQYTEIKPVKSGVSFTFDIRFENLSQVELGLLLWVLSLSSDKSQSLNTGKPNEKYCFSLGMGKPLGMGAVEIDYEIAQSDRSQRYKSLFTDSDWNYAEFPITIDQQKELISAFESYMLDYETGIGRSDHPRTGNASKLKEVPRIEMLLAMLRFDESPPTDKTRYMKIEPNEYKDRRVLPTPLDIMNIKDNRQMNEPVEVDSDSSERTAVDLVNFFKGA